MTAELAERPGRADLHIHTLASDGTSSVAEILDRVEREGVLDVIAITDHERIDAALAARRIAEARGLRVRVVVGEEISTRGGHLLGLFLEAPVPALRSLAWTIAAVHEQGGLAIPAHPTRPVPAVRPGVRAPATARRGRRRPAPRRDRDVQPDGARPVSPRPGRAVRGRTRPARARQQRRARGWRPSAAPGLRSRAGRRRTCGPRSPRGRRATTARSTGRPASSASSAGSCASTGATREPRSAAGSGATAPGATTATRAATSGRPASSRPSAAARAAGRATT